MTSSQLPTSHPPLSLRKAASSPHLPTSWNCISHSSRFCFYCLERSEKRQLTIICPIGSQTATKQQTPPKTPSLKPYITNNTSRPLPSTCPPAPSSIPPPRPSGHPYSPSPTPPHAGPSPKPHGSHSKNPPQVRPPHPPLQTQPKPQTKQKTNHPPSPQQPTPTRQTTSTTSRTRSPSKRKARATGSPSWRR